MNTKNMLVGAMLILFFGVLLGCKSKEEKAAELIKNELSKTLYDFDSYQVIETTVKEAKNSPFNDSLCWAKATVLAVGLQQFIDKLQEANESVEQALIWGEPTYYSSSYSDRKYYNHMEDGHRAMTEANLVTLVCNDIADSLTEMIHCLDTSAIIGWEVHHSFRCKTKGGSSEIAHYRYVLDKKFKKILLREDAESKNDKHTRTALEWVIDGWDTISTVDLIIKTAGYSDLSDVR